LKTAEDYLDLPYHFVLVPDHWDDGTPGWFIRVEELPGCMSQGKSPNEAWEQIHDAMLGWIDVGLQDGHEIPLPRSDALPGYAITVTVPYGLDDEVVAAAAERGVSLDEFVADALAQATGWRPGAKAATKRAG
jgi:antitoxin HicB